MLNNGRGSAIVAGSTVIIPEAGEEGRGRVKVESGRGGLKGNRGCVSYKIMGFRLRLKDIP